MAPTRVFSWDPCSLGLSAMLTVAHFYKVNLADAHRQSSVSADEQNSVMFNMCFAVAGAFFGFWRRISYRKIAVHLRLALVTLGDAEIARAVCNAALCGFCKARRLLHGRSGQVP